MAWNPATKTAGLVLSNSDKTASYTASGEDTQGAHGMRGRSAGKHYFEISVDTLTGSSVWFIAGLSTADADLSFFGTLDCLLFASDGGIYADGASPTPITGYSSGDTLGIAIDMDAGKVWFAVDNAWRVSGNPAAGTNPTLTYTPGNLTSANIYPHIQFLSESSGTFAGTVAVESADFTYTPPSGFSEWGVAALDYATAPITITVSDPTGTTTAPITVSVTATGTATAPITIGVVDALATTEWSAKVMLGGVDISSRLYGRIDVDAEEGAARVASFAYLPTAGVVTPTAWTGATVTIDLLRMIGGTGVPARVFTGRVDLATFDATLGLVQFDCTDDLQNRVAALATAEIDTLCAGRYSTAVQGDILDKWDYSQDRMATRQASLDAGAHGGLRTSAWSGLSVWETFTEADVLDQTPSVELPRRIEIINKVEGAFEYRYHRCRERHASLAWNATIIGAAPGYVAYQQPTQGEIESALSGTGWHVVSSGFTSGWAYVITATPSGETGTWYVDVPGDNQVGSMSAHLMQRHAQTVTETYTITVTASESVTANGELATPMRGAMASTWNPDAWENDPTVLTPDASAGDVDYSTDASRANADAAILTLIDLAKTKILASHRQASVSFSVACLPEIDLVHAATLDTARVNASGKVARVQHSMDLQGGTATTRITLALSGVAAGGIISDTSVAVPDAPAIVLDDDPWATTVPPLQNHYGAISGAVYNDALSGYFCNAPENITVTDMTDSITEANAAYTAGTAYPFTGFRITMPGVAESHRNPLELDQTAEYIVNIPADTFTLEV